MSLMTCVNGNRSTTICAASKSRQTMMLRPGASNAAANPAQTCGSSSTMRNVCKQSCGATAAPRSRDAAAVVHVSYGFVRSRFRRCQIVGAARHKLVQNVPDDLDNAAAGRIGVAIVADKRVRAEKNDGNECG